jgi:hypothetical protein
MTMEFLNSVILISLFGCAVIFIMMCVIGSSTDESIVGTCWGIGIGICVGICLGAAILNTHWEKFLITEKLGVYQTETPTSRDVVFKLIKQKE